MMSFSAKQVQALQRQPDSRRIRKREANGRELSYLEGWYAISEAKRMFGFDGWSRETVESRCVLARENKGTFLAVYIAKVRIILQADGLAVVREGHGTGEGRANTPGEVHDTALKAAETDATKRALATFGRPFGLELYKAGGASKGQAMKSARRTASQTASDDRAVSSAGHSSHQGHNGVEVHHPSAAPLPANDSVWVKTETVAASSVPTDVHNIPSDYARILLPSLHYAHQRHHDTRQHNATLARDSEQKAAEASLAQSEPEVFSRPKIDKSILTFGEPKRIRDKGHLKFVAAQPCLICGRQPSDAHHLRFAQPRALGRKVSDEFTIPLCRIHHREVHQTGNEAASWEDLEIDAIAIAKGLWDQSRLFQALLMRQASKVCKVSRTRLREKGYNEARKTG